MVATATPYVVRALHGGTEVAREAFACRDSEHAARLARYVALALARDSVHPREFDPRLVTFEVEACYPAAVPETSNAGLVTVKL